MTVRRRLLALLTIPLVTLFVAAGLASPAAAATFEEKLAVLSSWTQTSVSSYDAWNSARLNQGAWADYAFDWSTDYCSSSPDQPLGFDFRLPCWRHDFGYRNYKHMGLFTSSTKDRIDSAFYEDLKRKCATYSVWVRASCYSLAWSYYEAVRAAGTLSVSQASLDHAAQLKAEGEARALAEARGTS